jgi:hypothetical protein
MNQKLVVFDGYILTTVDFEIYSDPTSGNSITSKG